MSQPKTLAETVREAEEKSIREALRFTHGRKAEAAQVLSLSPKNLWEKMKAYSIDDSLGATVPEKEKSLDNQSTTYEYRAALVGEEGRVPDDNSYRGKIISRYPLNLGDVVMLPFGKEAAEPFKVINVSHIPEILNYNGMRHKASITQLILKAQYCPSKDLEELMREGR